MRLNTEKETVRAMIRLFCRKRHGGKTLCNDCEELLHYAEMRLSACPHADSKPPCRNCQTHCYAPAMRERITEVMRYAGPRLLFRHPLLTLRHLLGKKLKKQE